MGVRGDIYDFITTAPPAIIAKVKKEKEKEGDSGEESERERERRRETERERKRKKKERKINGKHERMLYFDITDLNCLF